MSKLLQCPFCESVAVFSTTGKACRVHCTDESKCTATTGYWQNENVAVAVWNTRLSATTSARDVREACKQAAILRATRCSNDLATPPNIRGLGPDNNALEYGKRVAFDIVKTIDDLNLDAAAPAACGDAAPQDDVEDPSLDPMGFNSHVNTPAAKASAVSEADVGRSDGLSAAQVETAVTMIKVLANTPPKDWLLRSEIYAHLKEFRTIQSAAQGGGRVSDGATHQSQSVVTDQNAVANAANVSSDQNRIVGTAGNFAIDDRLSLIPREYLTDPERRSLGEFESLKEMGTLTDPSDPPSQEASAPPIAGGR